MAPKNPLFKITDAAQGVATLPLKATAKVAGRAAGVVTGGVRVAASLIDSTAERAKSMVGTEDQKGESSRSSTSGSFSAPSPSPSGVAGTGFGDCATGCPAGVGGGTGRGGGGEGDVAGAADDAHPVQGGACHRADKDPEAQEGRIHQHG